MSYLSTTSTNTQTVRDAVDDLDGWYMVSSPGTNGKLFYALTSMVQQMQTGSTQDSSVRTDRTPSYILWVQLEGYPSLLL